MNKNTKIISIVVTVIVIISGFAVYNNASKPAGSVTLGLMLPLSGDYAVAGENYKKGVELALDEYNAKHTGPTINLVVEDDGFDVKKGINAYKKLKEVDKIDALMMLSTPVIDAIHEDAVTTGIPIMQLGVQTVGIAKDNIFQVSPSGDAPIREFAAYLNKNYTFKKVAVVYDNTPGGLSFYKAFQASYKGEYTPFMLNSKADIRSDAIRIVADKYDSVIFMTSAENGAFAVKEILTLDPTPPFFGFDAQLQTGFADYVRILGDANKLNGARSIWLKSGNGDHFKAAFKQKFGEEPGFIADFGYDIFNVLMEKYSKDDKTWLANIQSTNEAGVSGPVSFDENGVRIQPIVVNKIEGGKITPVE